MALIGPKKQPPAIDEAAERRLLAAYPVRSGVLEWDVVDEHAVIALPKTYSTIERAIARFFPGPEAVFVTLDELGTAGWLFADGTRPVADAAADLRARFGERAEPAERRAVAFYAGLARRSFVRLLDRPAPLASERRGLTSERGYVRPACRRCGVAHPLKAPPGARYACPRCRAVNRIPRADEVP